MSHSRAYAFTRDVSEADLRPTLLSAVEELFYLSDAMESGAMRAELWPALGAIASIQRAGETMVGSVGELREDLETSRKETEDAEGERDEALQAARSVEVTGHGTVETFSADDVRDLRASLAKMTAERDAALARIDNVKTLVESHSDLVSMARRFTSAALSAGVPLKHARAVPRTRKAGGQ